MQKRAKEFAITSNLNRRVAHNYRNILKQAFNTLAGGQVKSNMHTLISLVEKLILLRKHNAFSAILYASDRKRRDAIRDGLHRLVKSVQKFRERRLAAAVNAMRIDNPWFQRVLSIMTLKTHADTQISYWRLKY